MDFAIRESIEGWCMGQHLGVWIRPKLGICINKDSLDTALLKHFLCLAFIFFSFVGLKGFSQASQSFL
jgi:hypothetical protein